jgi:hypothetical protein
MKLDYPFLIYPEINGINNFSHVFLVDRELPKFLKYLNLSKKQIYPIIYSTFSSKINLLNLFSENFMYIKTLTLCFNSLASENPPMFLDGEPLFFNKELETDYTNNNIIYSNNLIFLLNLINTFNIQRIDFLISDSFNYTNWVKYYDLLKKKTGITIGVSSEKNVNFDGTLTIKYEYQNISPTYSTENVQTNKLSLGITDFITITSGSYTLTTSDNNYILKFDEDSVGYFNYDNISVNCIIVGGGGGGGGGGDGGTFNENFGGGGGGGGGGGITGCSFNTTINTTVNITIGTGGNGGITGNNGESGGNSVVLYGSELIGTATGGYYGSLPDDNNSSGGNGGNSGNNGVGGLGSYYVYNDEGYGTFMPSEDGINGSGGGGASNNTGGGIVNNNYGSDGAISSTSVFYYGTDFGAGGGGGSYYPSAGGTGGNKYASSSTGSYYNDATSNYGGGGAGGQGNYTGYNGTGYNGISASSGGSGTVVLYFSMDVPTTTTTTTTDTPTTTTTDTTDSISNICFSSKTPIQTDQGIFHISKINPKIHTINNKKIVAITKSITQDKHLVRIGKDSFSLNYPNKDIILTKKHNIYFKGKMMEAHKFIGHYDKITLVRYNGETLYNILMEKYDVVKVNNILCETLHPENIIAKLYTSYISDDYKNKITIAINDCIKKNDYDSYKKIERRLNKELEHVKHNVF